MDRKSICIKIAQIRQSKNISAYELSLRLDKAANYMSYVEMGKVNIKLDTLLMICKELGINPKELFD